MPPYPDAFSCFAYILENLPLFVKEYIVTVFLVVFAIYFISRWLHD